MIPLKEQDAVTQKFAAELAGPVKIDHFTERNLGLTLPNKKPALYSKEARAMLSEIAGLSDLISLRMHYFEDNPPEKANRVRDDTESGLSISQKEKDLVRRQRKQVVIPKETRNEAVWALFFRTRFNIYS